MLADQEAEEDPSQKKGGRNQKIEGRKVFEPVRVAALED